MTDATCNELRALLEKKEREIRELEAQKRELEAALAMYRKAAGIEHP